MGNTASLRNAQSKPCIFLQCCYIPRSECILNCVIYGSPLSSDRVIKASPVLVTILPPLFTAFVRHSYLPPNLRNCILKLIPKPHKDPTLSDSYRPIALAPTLSKSWNGVSFYNILNILQLPHFSLGLKSICLSHSVLA